MAVKTIAFMLPWVDPLSANSNLYNAGVIARIETSIADRAITAGKALEINANIFDQQLNTTDSPTFAGLTVDTNTLFVDAPNNRVGIGTTSPNTELDVDGTATANSIRVRRSVAAHSLEYLDISVGDRRAHFHSVQDETTGTGGGFQFDLGGSTSISDAFLISQQSNFASGTPSNTLFAVLASGNVGIGTTSPDARLHASHTTGSVALLDMGGASNSDYGLKITANETNFEGDHSKSGSGGGMLHLYHSGAGSTSGGDYIVARNASTTHFWVDGAGKGYFAGNVGIGNTSPAYTIDTFNNAIIRVGTNGRFQGGATADTAMGYFEPRDLSSGHATLQSAIISGTPFELHLNPSGGNVGIGTTGPGAKLHVNGTVRLQNLPTSASGLSAGDLWNDGGTLKIA